MPEPAIVHIIDDDASMRDALHRLFRSTGQEARRYATVREFLEADDRDGPGCLVLDVRLPGTSGLDFQRQLSASGVHLPVILMTGFGDIPMSVQAMKAGAVDFLTKPFRDQDMLDAVALALERDRARKALNDDVQNLRALFDTLSHREQQVMAGVTAGALNKQVAADLGLSEVTVKIHRGAGMRKMGARNFVDFVRMADALGLKASDASA